MIITNDMVEEPTREEWRGRPHGWMPVSHAVIGFILLGLILGLGLCAALITTHVTATNITQ